MSDVGSGNRQSADQDGADCLRKRQNRRMDCGKYYRKEKVRDGEESVVHGDPSDKMGGASPAQWVR